MKRTWNWISKLGLLTILGLAGGMLGQVFTGMIPAGIGQGVVIPQVSAQSAPAFPFTVAQQSAQAIDANVSSFTFTFPQATAASGNTAFMLVSTDGSASVGLPAGWTADINQTQASFARFILLHKATASDTSATFTLASSTIAVFFFELAGSRSLDQSSVGGTANSANLVLPSITPSAGAAVFGMCGVVANGPLSLSQPLAASQWATVLVQGGSASDRGLIGYFGNFSAVNAPTAPPPLIGIPPLFSSGGMAYATFSIK